MAIGFDCASKLNATSAKALKAAGFEFVARYLPTTAWKGLSAEEANLIKAAGLKLVSIFEKEATKLSYFTKAQGVSDAQEAYKLAKAVGQPSGSTIYFAVDYEAQPAHMGAIIEYLSGIKQCLVDYKVGLYGSYAVMMAVKGKVDYYWQTYAWSKGQVADHIHMHQYQNGVNVCGVQLDRNDIRQSPGAWNESCNTDGPKPIMKLKALKVTSIRKAPSFDAEYVRDTMIGELFDGYKLQGDWVCVGGDANGEFWIIGDSSKNLSWIDNPALKQQAAPAAPQPGYHKVVTGDTVSKLAARYGSTIAQIKTWNNLDDKCAIYAGKSIRVK
jgi:hypothetical protein